MEPNYISEDGATIIDCDKQKLQKFFSCFHSNTEEQKFIPFLPVNTEDIPPQGIWKAVQSTDGKREPHDREKIVCRPVFQSPPVVQSLPVVQFPFPKQVEKNILQLLQSYPEGLEIEKFNVVYLKTFGEALIATDFGYADIVDLLAALHVSVQSGKNGQQLLVASESETRAQLTKEEEEQQQQLLPHRVPAEIIEMFKKVIKQHCGGISLENFIAEYEVLAQKKLIISDLGFSSVYDLVSYLGGIFKILKINSNFIIYHPSVKDVSGQVPSFTEESTADSANIFPPEAGNHSVKALQDEYLESIAKEALADVCKKTPSSQYPVDAVSFGMTYRSLEWQVLMPVGEFVDVVVGEVYSPGKFWVIHRGVQTSEELDRVMNKMFDFYNSEVGDQYLVQQGHLIIGAPVVAYYAEDKHYYRALIRSVDDTRVKVFLVDYGTVLKCNYADLRLLHQHFFTLPTQGIKAALDDVLPAKGRLWLKAASKRFLCTVQNKGLVAHIVSLKETVYLDLWDTSGKADVNIAQILIEEGWAVPRSDRIGDYLAVRTKVSSSTNDGLFATDLNQQFVINIPEKTKALGENIADSLLESPMHIYSHDLKQTKDVICTREDKHMGEHCNDLGYVKEKLCDGNSDKIGLSSHWRTGELRHPNGIEVIAHKNLNSVGDKQSSVMGDSSVTNPEVLDEKSKKASHFSQCNVVPCDEHSKIYSSSVSQPEPVFSYVACQKKVCKKFPNAEQLDIYSAPLPFPYREAKALNIYSIPTDSENVHNEKEINRIAFHPSTTGDMQFVCLDKGRPVISTQSLTTHSEQPNCNDENPFIGIQLLTMDGKNLSHEGEKFVSGIHSLTVDSECGIVDKGKLLFDSQLPGKKCAPFVSTAPEHIQFKEKMLFSGAQTMVDQAPVCLLKEEPISCIPPVTTAYEHLQWKEEKSVDQPVKTVLGKLCEEKMQTGETRLITPVSGSKNTCRVEPSQYKRSIQPPPGFVRSDVPPPPGFSRNYVPPPPVTEYVTKRQPFVANSRFSPLFTETANYFKGYDFMEGLFNYKSLQQMEENIDAMKIKNIETVNVTPYRKFNIVQLYGNPYILASDISHLAFGVHNIEVVLQLSQTKFQRTFIGLTTDKDLYLQLLKLGSKAVLDEKTLQFHPYIAMYSLCDVPEILSLLGFKDKTIICGLQDLNEKYIHDRKAALNIRNTCQTKKVAVQSDCNAPLFHDYPCPDLVSQVFPLGHAQLFRDISSKDLKSDNCKDFAHQMPLSSYAKPSPSLNCISQFNNPQLDEQSWHIIQETAYANSHQNMPPTPVNLSSPVQKQFNHKSYYPDIGKNIRVTSRSMCTNRNSVSSLPSPQKPGGSQTILLNKPGECFQPKVVTGNLSVGVTQKEMSRSKVPSDLFNSLSVDPTAKILGSSCYNDNTGVHHSINLESNECCKPLKSNICNPSKGSDFPSSCLSMTADDQLHMISQTQKSDLAVSLHTGVSISTDGICSIWEKNKPLGPCQQPQSLRVGAGVSQNTSLKTSSNISCVSNDKNSLTGLNDGIYNLSSTCQGLKVPRKIRWLKNPTEGGLRRPGQISPSFEMSVFSMSPSAQHKVSSSCIVSSL